MVKAKDVTKKKWTLMVYLAGDNNLDAAGTADVMEMKQVGSNDDINIVVQFDRAGAKRKTNRYFLRKGTTMAKDVVQVLAETNTGDPKVLKDFIGWGITNYPAERYLLVLWNHGAGWDDSNLYTGDYFGGATPPVVRKRTTIAEGTKRGALKPVQASTVRAGAHRARRALFATTFIKQATTRAICFDDQAKDFLDNMEMKRVLTDVKKQLKRKIDVLGFDACLMSMVEVAYQVKGAVSVTCGSEEEEPNEGWPYDRVLKALAAKPTMSPQELGATVTREYLASYKANEGVTFAATDLAAIDPLAKAIDGLGKELSTALSDASLRTTVSACRSQVQEYTSPYDDYVDLVDLCDVLSHNLNRSEVTSACDAVKAAAAKAVIAHGAKGTSVANSNGISIYFPKKQVCSLYANLDFVKKNAWTGFVKNYVAGLGNRSWVN